MYGEVIVGNTNGLVVNSGNGDVTFHGTLNAGNSYTFVNKTNDTNRNWDWARTDAKNNTAGGSGVGESYLVNITSRLENAIAGLTANYSVRGLVLTAPIPTAMRGYGPTAPKPTPSFTPRAAPLRQATTLTLARASPMAA